MPLNEPKDIVVQVVFDDIWLHDIMGQVYRPYGPVFLSNDFSVAEFQMIHEYIMPKLKRNLADYVVENITDEWFNLRGEPWVFSFALTKERMFAEFRVAYRRHIKVSRAQVHNVHIYNDGDPMMVPWRMRSFVQEIGYRVKRAWGKCQKWRMG